MNISFQRLKLPDRLSQTTLENDQNEIETSQTEQLPMPDLWLVTKKEVVLIHINLRNAQTRQTISCKFLLVDWYQFGNSTVLSCKEQTAVGGRGPTLHLSHLSAISSLLSYGFLTKDHLDVRLPQAARLCEAGYFQGTTLKKTKYSELCSN